MPASNIHHPPGPIDDDPHDPDEPAPAALPVAPDDGPVPSASPDDPERDRRVDPED